MTKPRDSFSYNFKTTEVKFIFLILILFFIQNIFASEFNTQELEKLISQNPKTQKPMTKIEDLLPYLPMEFKKNFTFVFESQSPFKDSISSLYPRVVLFSADTGFIITFTGDPNKKGYNVLETINFDEENSNFNFNYYDLNNNTKKSLKEIQSDCFKCHGTDPRPIFESYPLWPGFYGSVLDSFPESLSQSNLEYKNYLKFLSQSSKKGLYKYLEFLPGSRTTPYLEPELLKLNEHKEATILNTKYKPNERFGIAATALNKKRIFRKLKESPLYNDLKKDLLYELLDCGTSKVSEIRINKIKQLLILENNNRIKMMKAEGKEKGNELLQMQELIFVKELAQLDWLSEKLKIDRSDWSMAPMEGSLSFFDGILSGVHEDKTFYMKEDFIFEMLKELSESEKKYKPYFKIGYNLKSYDLGFIDKISWPEAILSCKELGKDLLASKFKEKKSSRFFHPFLDWIKEFKFI